MTLANTTIFTFHNVSINSVMDAMINATWFHLHSIMYLLIPAHRQRVLLLRLYLHSIMYLLILFRCQPSNSYVAYLHSIMYLLIHISPLPAVQASGTFTFHNVSINSTTSNSQIGISSEFTFHNVSINSKLSNCVAACCADLHSIMYLLIPLIAQLFLPVWVVHLHSIMYLLIPLAL